MTKGETLTSAAALTPAAVREHGPTGVSGVRPRVLHFAEAETEASPPTLEISLLRAQLEACQRENESLARRLDEAMAELAELRQRLGQAAPSIPVRSEPYPPRPDEPAPSTDGGTDDALDGAPTMSVNGSAGSASLQRVLVSLPPPTPDERRECVRQGCDFEVEFLSDTHFTVGLTEDISTGGMFIATYHLLPVGSAVDLRFELPSGDWIETSGTVRWTRERTDEAPPGLGILFSELSETALVALSRYCRARPPLYFDF